MLGYYKIKQGILQQNLSKYYRFKRAETLCKYFNKFINTLKTELKESYPWLDSSDERKYMTSRKILDKHIDLDSVREEDKTFINKEVKRLCYLGILKEDFSLYSSPIMLISRKLMKDKTVVTEFRHLNVWIVMNNLAYPLLKDTFSVLGSSKCEVLLVLDLKDAFHSLRLSENSKTYCGIWCRFLILLKYY